MPRDTAAFTIAAASGCALPCSTAAASRIRSSSVAAGRDFNRCHLRTALRERAGLVHDERADAAQELQRFRVLDEDTGLCALTGADHDGHRGGQAERARARDDEHRDGVHERVSEARRGAPDAPGHEREGRCEQNGRDEVPGQAIRQPLNRRARALRLPDHPHDLCEQRLRPDPLGPHRERAVDGERRADDAIAGTFVDRYRLARHHRLVHGCPAVDHHAVYRDFLARAYAQLVAGLHERKRHVFFTPVPDDAAPSSAPGREADESPRRFDAAPAAPAPVREARGR